MAWLSCRRTTLAASFTQTKNSAQRRPAAAPRFRQMLSVCAHPPQASRDPTSTIHAEAGTRALYEERSRDRKDQVAGQAYTSGKGRCYTQRKDFLLQGC